MNAATAVNPTMLNDHSQRQSHGHCGHPATKAGRAWCRRQQAKAAGVPNTPKRRKTIAASTITGEAIPANDPIFEGAGEPFADWDETKAEVVPDELTMKRLAKRSTKELSTLIKRDDLDPTIRRAATAIIDRRTR